MLAPRPHAEASPDPLLAIIDERVALFEEAIWRNDRSAQTVAASYVYDATSRWLTKGGTRPKTGPLAGETRFRISASATERVRAIHDRALGHLARVYGVVSELEIRRAIADHLGAINSKSDLDQAHMARGHGALFLETEAKRFPYKIRFRGGLAYRFDDLKGVDGRFTLHDMWKSGESESIDLRDDLLGFLRGTAPVPPVPEPAEWVFGSRGSRARSSASFSGRSLASVSFGESLASRASVGSRVSAGGIGGDASRDGVRLTPHQVMRSWPGSRASTTSSGRRGSVSSMDREPPDAEVDDRVWANGNDGWVHYAMASSGRLYVGRRRDVVFFHSSLLGSENGLCAGMIRIRDGVITEINLESEHYLPGPTQLSQMLRRLEVYGVDLARIVVYLFGDAKPYAAEDVLAEFTRR